MPTVYSYPASSSGFANPMTTQYDLIVGGASGAATRLAGPANFGQVLSKQAAAFGWNYPLDPSRIFEFREDWTAATAVGDKNWTSTATGAGSGASLDGTLTNATTLGILEMPTGTTTTGRTAVHMPASHFVLGAGETYCEMRVRLSALSDGTNRYFTLLGLHDGNGAGEPTDGIYWRYQDDVNGAEWQAICRAGGAESTLDTNIVVASGAWMRLAWRLNAAASSIEFFHNGTTVGSIGSNIPSAALAPAMKIEKTAGTTSRSVFNDYFFLVREIARA